LRPSPMLKLDKLLKTSSASLSIKPEHNYTTRNTHGTAEKAPSLIELA
jgi:hypothetical protein